MTTNGWEQRLADLGQARELREEIAASLWHAQPEYTVSPWGDISETTREQYRTKADALLSDPLAPLLELAADPLHEVSCPSCGATIRARMADQP